MKLVPDARRWWKMFSVQALIVITGIQGLLLNWDVTELLQPVPFFPDFTWKTLGNSLSIAAAVIGIIGRMVDQGFTPPTDKDQ